MMCMMSKVHVYDVPAYTASAVVVSHHYVCVRVAAYPLSGSLCVHVLQYSALCVLRTTHYALRTIVFDVHNVHDVHDVYDVYDVPAYTGSAVVVSHHYVCVRVAAYPLSGPLCVHVLQYSAL